MKSILTALIMIGFLGAMAHADEGARVGAATKKHHAKKKRGPASVKKKKKKKKKKSHKHSY